MKKSDLKMIFICYFETKYNTVILPIYFNGNYKREREREREK